MLRRINAGKLGAPVGRPAVASDVPSALSETKEPRGHPADRGAHSSAKSITQSWAFRRRGLVGGLCLSAAALVSIFGTPLIGGAGLLGLLLNLAGWLLFLLYAGMRIWATLYIGGAKDRRLQTKGPYSVTRNPLYLGSISFALSAACFLKSFTVIALALAAALFYFRWVIPAEEEVLEGIFGQAFRDYKRRTPRAIPRPSLYQADPTVEANLRALRTEAKRLFFASMMPFLLLYVLQLRQLPWWPHFFRLP
jgi:protein-S-isoprenylcysteine O-methyltransferase Ste14